MTTVLLRPPDVGLQKAPQNPLGANLGRENLGGAFSRFVSQVLSSHPQRSKNLRPNQRNHLASRCLGLQVNGSIFPRPCVGICCTLTGQRKLPLLYSELLAE